MYSIYVHTTPDGRKYVGCTGQEPNRRFRRGSHYKNNTNFSEAIKFFGWDKIQHDVITTAESKETALKLEEYYTLLWRTNEPEFGYNIYHGQKGERSEKTRLKVSEKLKGRTCSTKGMHRVYNEDGSFHFEKTQDN